MINHSMNRPRGTGLILLKTRSGIRDFFQDILLEIIGHFKPDISSHFQVGGPLTLTATWPLAQSGSTGQRSRKMIVMVAQSVVAACVRAEAPVLMAMRKKIVEHIRSVGKDFNPDPALNPNLIIVGLGALCEP